MAIDYTLENDSFYYFENISKIWLENLGLTTEESSYHSFSQKIIKFNILITTLRQIVNNSNVNFNQIYQNINNDFIKKTLNLQIDPVSFLIAFSLYLC